METAADVVAHPAEGHRPQGAEHHRARRFGAGAGVFAGQEQEFRRTRELRRVTEAAAAFVEAARPLGRRRVEHGVIRRCPIGRRRRSGAQPGDRGGGRRGDAGGILTPRPGHLAADVEQRRPPPGRGRRKVGAAVERLERRRQPDAHRPAAAAGGRLHEGHVDAIDVGPLLAIDLDADEVAVEDGGGRVVLERLVGHHMAPVARRVADRQEDRHPAVAGGGKRLVAPRIPIDRVGGVLRQIRARFARQAVHRFDHMPPCRSPAVHSAAEVVTATWPRPPRSGDNVW